MSSFLHDDLKESIKEFLKGWNMNGKDLEVEEEPANFLDWCVANGYEDICLSLPEQVDWTRFDQAMNRFREEFK